MAEHPITQDIRAEMTLMITDDILTNNRVIDPGNPPKVPVTYAEWDDTIEGVRFTESPDHDMVYMYVPVGTKTSESRTIDEDFITTWLKGKRVVILNGYELMTLGSDKHWTYQDHIHFERFEITSIDPTWRGYNMVSQWYWLSDTPMFDLPEYIECACWSVPYSSIHQ